MKRTKQEYTLDVFQPGTVVRKFSGKKFKGGSMEATVVSQTVNPNCPSGITPAVMLDNGTVVSICQLYPVERVVIEDEGPVRNADIKCTGLTVLTGPSGCGKTLLFDGFRKECLKYGGDVKIITPKVLIDTAPDDIPADVFRRKLITTIRMEIKCKSSKRKLGHDSERWSDVSDIRSLGDRMLLILLDMIQHHEITSRTVFIISDAACFMDLSLAVEFARIIVMIMKTYRCRFLISTYIPDLVTALQRFALGESIPEEDVRFYTAVERKDEFGVYDYVDNGSEINICFDEFNKAIYKLEWYSTPLNEEIQKIKK